MKLFVEVYRLHLSVFTHWDTLALWWCAKTETEKTETEYLRLKTEPNRTEFEKSKPTQPYWRPNVRPLRLGEEIKKEERKKKPQDENMYVRILLCRVAIDN